MQRCPEAAEQKRGDMSEPSKSLMSLCDAFDKIISSTLAVHILPDRFFQRKNRETSGKFLQRAGWRRITATADAQLISEVLLRKPG